MRVRHILFPLMGLAFSACGSQLSTSEQASATQPPSEAPLAVAPEAVLPAPIIEAAAEPAPALTLSVMKSDGRVTLAVQNRGRSNVRFNSNVLLEEGDAHRTLPLQLDDTHPLPACAELAPGALLELNVTDADSTAPLRFALTSCGGNARTESERFTL